VPAVYVVKEFFIFIIPAGTVNTLRNNGGKVYNLKKWLFSFIVFLTRNRVIHHTKRSATKLRSIKLNTGRKIGDNSYIIGSYI